MPLNPALIYAELSAARASGGFPFAGFKFDQFASGVANGVAAWAIGQPQNVALQGISTGAVGSGVVALPTTRVFVPPTVPLMVAAFSGAGYNGPLAPSLATVVTIGLSGAFTKFAGYTGPVVGVGAGQDVAKVIVANPATLQPLLASSLLGSLGGLGPSGVSLTVGLANGIAGLILLGVGTGTIIGSPGPGPGSGTSTSVIV